MQMHSNETFNPLRSSSSTKIYDSHVICIREEANIQDAVHLMRTNHIGDVIVVQDKNQKTVPIGIVTDRDVALALDSDKPPKIVADCMTGPIAVGRASDDIFTLIETMRNYGVGRLPLVDPHGSLVGIITAKKVLQRLTQALHDLAFFSDRQQKNEENLKH